MVVERVEVLVVQWVGRCVLVLVLVWKRSLATLIIESLIVGHLILSLLILPILVLAIRWDLSISQLICQLWIEV